MKEAVYIDINSDLGEGTGDDQGIMPLISSCNIACGGHFGDEASIRDTLELARRHHVKSGAHPSFPDRDSFGRKLLTITKEELTDSLIEQLQLFYMVCDKMGIQNHHIKLHGALYNYAARDAPTADAVLDAILQAGPRHLLYVPYGSVLHRKAENLLPLKFEAFIDRRYANDLSLSDRNLQGAIIHSPSAAWEQLRSMVEEGTLRTIEGEDKQINATTYCIHGDHPNSLRILKYIRSRMKEHSIYLDQ